MKRKLHGSIASIVLMLLGNALFAQTSFTYNFNTDLTGVVTAVNGGSPAVGSLPFAFNPGTSRAIFDGAVQNTTGVLRHQTISGLSNNTCVNDLTLFPSSANYSVTWKEYINTRPSSGAVASHRRGFLLRGQTVAASPYAPGMRNGYLFLIVGDNLGRVQFQIRAVVNGTLPGAFTTSSAIYLDGGTTQINLDKAYYYRVSVTGSSSVVLTFEYSLDGTTWVTGATHTDSSAGRFTSAGATQTVTGIGSSSYTYHYLDNVTFTSNDPNTTWNGTAWSNGAPTASQRAIINSNYSAAGNLVAGDLEVTGNAAVTIPSGSRFTVGGPLTVAATASLTVENNAHLIQPIPATTNTNVGNITVKRNGSALKRLDFAMWSSPVGGAQTLANFSPNTSRSPSRFYTFDGANNRFDNTLITPNSTFAAGRGYLIRMPNSDALAGYNEGSSTLAFPGVFTGVPNNGNVSLTALTANRFYSIGNPYPSAISATQFRSGNPLAGGTLYFWRKANSANQSTTSYATWTTAGGVANTGGGSNVAPDGTIQVGQGFIVSTGTATALHFTNAMREVAPTSTQFFKTKQVGVKDRIWLNLTNTSGVFSQALVAYMDGATVGVDNGIDGLYFNDAPVALTSNIDGGEYTIQGRPAFDVTDNVALNFKTDVAGEYTIGIDRAEGVFVNGQDVYLLDKTTGIETDLNKGAYLFSATAGSTSERFVLKYQKTLKIDSPLFNDNTVKVFRNNDAVRVQSGSIAIAIVRIFDVQGRLILEQKNVKSKTVSFSNLKAKNQVLVVQVISEDNSVVTKKIIN